MSDGWKTVKRRRKGITRAVRDEVWRATAGHCWYCGEDLNVEPENYRHHPNIDHLTSVAESVGDEIENLVLACYDCNVSKWTKSLEEYRKAVGNDWARSVSYAVDVIDYIEDIYEFSFASGLMAQLKNVMAACQNGRLSFYGETLAPEYQEPLDFQI
jgi:hypothetical protein